MEGGRPARGSGSGKDVLDLENVTVVRCGESLDEACDAASIRDRKRAVLPAGGEGDLRVNSIRVGISTLLDLGRWTRVASTVKLEDIDGDILSARFACGQQRKTNEDEGDSDL